MPSFLNQLQVLVIIRRQKYGPYIFGSCNKVCCVVLSTFPVCTGACVYIYIYIYINATNEAKLRRCAVMTEDLNVLNQLIKIPGMQSLVTTSCLFV